MVSRKVVVKNATGLHLRPAGVLCNLAEQFQSSIRFQTGGGASGGNAKSVLSVLGACIRHGDELEFICEGADETEALRAVVEAVEQGLGEELSHQKQTEQEEDLTKASEVGEANT